MHFQEHDISPAVQIISLPCSEILPHKSIKKERHHDLLLSSTLTAWVVLGVRWEWRLFFKNLVTELAYNIVGNQWCGSIGQQCSEIQQRHPETVKKKKSFFIIYCQTIHIFVYTEIFKGKVQHFGKHADFLSCWKSFDIVQWLWGYSHQWVSIKTRNRKQLLWICPKLTKFSPTPLTLTD